MKLQIGRTYGAKLLLLLAIVACCLFQFMLHRQSETFREYEAAFLSLQSLVMGCLALWCAGFLWLTFERQDLPLIGLLLVIIGFFFLGHTANPSRDALTLLAGVTLGRGVKFFLSRSSQREEALNKESESKKWKAEMSQSLLTSAATFLVGLLALLVFAAWWRLDMSDNYYHGSRWMGLWDNPNTYGMLMAAGSALAIGMLAAKAESGKRKAETLRQTEKWKEENGNLFLRSLRFFAAIKSAIGNWQSAMLFVAAGMLGVGLVMSYSRGAWLATGVALLYLAWCYGKLKWRYVAVGVGLLAIGVGLVWGSTHDSAPWYVKRADLGRPSAQNRATAWRAGLEIMRDHPLGVGWNKAVKIYGDSYHPPEGGPAALTTNDYLMIGTELGIPALVCFLAYVALCYRKSPRIQKLEFRSQEQSSAGVSPAGEGQNLPLAQTGGTPILLSETGKMPVLLPETGGTRCPTLPDARRQTQDAFQESEKLRAACLAGALVFVVAFWFDGGLFKLPTAALFWVLLELGAYRGKAESGNLRPET